MNITRAMRYAVCLCLTVLALDAWAKPLRRALNYEAATAKFTMKLDSDNGDFVGKGDSYNYTEAEAESLFVNVFTRTESHGQPDYIEIIFFGNEAAQDHSWSLTLGSNELGEPLAVGEYPTATRAPFAEEGTAGLSFTMNGAGCNQVTGNFRITAIEFDCINSEAGSVITHLKRLEVEFESHCEGNDPAMHGSFSLTDDAGAACDGTGGTPGGGGTPLPPPPPPDVTIHLPASVTEQPIVIGNDGSASFEISTSVLDTFNGDVHLSLASDAPFANAPVMVIDPEHIAAPGTGTATVHISTGPMTFPRDYLVHVLATTSEGKTFASQTIHLHVVCDPPMILGTDQPRAVTVDRGARGSLSVKATGSGPFSYQWYRGHRGSTRFPVAGATEATFDDAAAGSYWVRVSNACGSADSATVAVRER